MAEAQAPALPGGTEAEWRAMVPREPKEANIGPGRKYKTRAAYEEAVAEWRQKKAARDELAPAREKAQAALRESRRPERDRAGLLPSGAAGRQKRKAASRSPHALSLIENGCPELADLVDDKSDETGGDMEFEWMETWAEEHLGIEEGELKDEHIPLWRASSDYHEFRRARPPPQPSDSPSHSPPDKSAALLRLRLSMCHKPMCKVEEAAFEQWAARFGGLEGSRGRSDRGDLLTPSTPSVLISNSSKAISADEFEFIQSHKR